MGVRGSTVLPITLLALTAAGSGACSAHTKHKILSFLFDGVPAPKPSPTPGPSPGAARPPATVAVAPVVFTHVPFGQNKCLSCHDGTSGNRVAADATLCFRCHKEDHFKGKAVHPPVEAGDCLLCHDPHTAPYKFQLKRAPPSLCHDCHDPADLAKVKPHSLAGERVCTECHSPHASDFPVQLIANAQRPICFNCHKAQAGLDPEQLLHGPAALGECFECHVSHRDAAKAGSPLRKPVPSLCWECHDASLMAGKVKHAPAEAGECVQCHSPHGTKNAKFLVEVVPDLCATCHQGIEHVDDMLKERQVCTECHSPHSSPNEHLLKE